MLQNQENEPKPFTLQEMLIKTMYSRFEFLPVLHKFCITAYLADAKTDIMTQIKYLSFESRHQ